MKITKTYNWNRRDFCFDSECEHCGHKEKKAMIYNFTLNSVNFYIIAEKNNSGYDDSNYYNNVVPDMKCCKCGGSSNSKQIHDAVKTVVIPKYNENLVI